MARFPQLAGQTIDELMGSFVGPNHVRNMPAAEQTQWLAAVAERIAESNAGGLSFLLSYMPHANAVRLHALLVALSLVGQRLPANRRGELCGHVLALLDDSRPLIVAEAIDTLRCLGCSDVADRIFALRVHAEPAVVASVLQFLSRHDSKRAVPILESALQADSPIVREAAIFELDELHIVSALPHIRRLLNDPEQVVREAAESAVGRLQKLRGDA